MRAIERTMQFKRDCKREMKGRCRANNGSRFDDRASSARRRCAAGGEVPRPSAVWRVVRFRDCHVKPDLVLIYEKPDPDTSRLVRLGSHSELGW